MRCGSNIDWIPPPQAIRLIDADVVNNALYMACFEMEEILELDPAEFRASGLEQKLVM